MKLHDVAERLKHLPFYLHPTIDAVVSEAIKRGRDITDVSTGDPEFPAPTWSERCRRRVRNLFRR
jgi:hypothetical protein